jgi:formate dehydrogenase major subunit
LSLDNPNIAEKISFTLDGKKVTAKKEETIWQVAKRIGVAIPHLCWKDAPGYRADGNCRACMVEIEGERVLAASCIRTPSEGMTVFSKGDRVESNRKIVFDLLASDMPKRETSPDPDSHFWSQAAEANFSTPSFPSGRPGAKKEIPVDSIFHDASHPSISVNLDACISCGLCERACKEVQVNDVIGMANRGIDTIPTFDITDSMGVSSCVACGECVQACPTGALMEKSLLNDKGTVREVYPDKKNRKCMSFLRCGL